MLELQQRDPPRSSRAWTEIPPLEPKAKPAPLDRPSFTFIDHDDDLTSKRIKDVNARKAIRSHVMRDVRRRERLAGLKRTSRQNRGQSNASKATINESDEQRLVLRASSQSSASSSILDTDSGDGFTSIYRGRPVRWCAGYPLPLHSNPNPPTSWFLDPFFTLPGTSELPSMVAHLVYYCKYYSFNLVYPSRSRCSYRMSLPRTRADHMAKGKPYSYR